MKTIQPVYLHGRWIVMCPKHSTLGAMDAEAEYICPVCYPQAIAFFLRLENGKLVKEPDNSARKTARALAEQNDEVYNVVMPSNKEEIENILSTLPPHYQNWRGESIDEVRKNAAFVLHVIDNYEKRNKSLDG